MRVVVLLLFVNENKIKTNFTMRTVKEIDLLDYQNDIKRNCTQHANVSERNFHSYIQLIIKNLFFL